MHANNARIAKLPVTRTAGIAEEAAPSATATGTGAPAPRAVLLLDMKAGSSDAGNRTLMRTCYDRTAGGVSPARASGASGSPPRPLSGTGAELLAGSQVAW
jgi:hypothetical protein